MKLVYFLLLSAALVGCATTKLPSSATMRVPATFDFSPPSRAQIGAANMTVALIRPTFVSKEPEYLVPPYSEMATSMGNDFEEMLTAKGFTIRGPFGSRDEMVYNDKTTSDFAIEVSIDLRHNYNRKYATVANWGTLVNQNANTNFYKMNGEITFSGDLIITASSPQYGEKLWKKNIHLQPQSFTYSGSAKWNSVPGMADELKQDNVVYNTVARELEKYYQGALSLCWQQIDPKEMQTISAQAKKADRK